MTYLWIAFGVLFFSAMFVELFTTRHAHEVSTKEAGVRTAIWVALALIFNAGIFIVRGAAPAQEFLTGYLIELALSVDNLFVFIMLFAAFLVPAVNRQRVLTWGILGAIIMRTIMVFVGATLFVKFEWLMYVFGAFLIYTGIKMAVPHEEKAADPSQNKIIKLIRRVIPVTDSYHQENFFVALSGKIHATPLFLVLIIVEATDVMFALDSIPAIFAITKDTFIVLTSNLFAIMGLRSLYFLLAGMMDKFRLLKYGLAAILTFIGTKMVVHYWHIKIPVAISLEVVVGILALSVAFSLMLAALRPSETK